MPTRLYSIIVALNVLITEHLWQLAFNPYKNCLGSRVIIMKQTWKFWFSNIKTRMQRHSW